MDTATVFTFRDGAYRVPFEGYTMSIPCVVVDARKCGRDFIGIAAITEADTDFPRILFPRPFGMNGLAELTDQFNAWKSKPKGGA